MFLLAKHEQWNLLPTCKSIQFVVFLNVKHDWSFYIESGLSVRFPVVWSIWHGCGVAHDILWSRLPVYYCRRMGLCHDYARLAAYQGCTIILMCNIYTYCTLNAAVTITNNTLNSKTHQYPLWITTVIHT